MASKNQQEQILTKEDINTNENIRRVDNRPGSIYSIVIFVLLFLAVYLFYPQISMILPIPGEKLTVKTGYQPTPITEMLDADRIIIATCEEKSDFRTNVTADNQPVVYRGITFSSVVTLKGEQIDNPNILEYGGNGLFQAGGTKKKYNVIYENSAEYEEGKTYLIFLDENGEAVNGKAGAIIQNDDGTFTDISGKNYTIMEIKALLGG